MKGRTDLAGAVSGGIGFAASANLNPARTGPSLFEPVHGAAHDIAGQGVANPLAAIHGLHKAFLLLGALTILSTFVFRSLQAGDGDDVARHKAIHSGE